MKKKQVSHFQKKVLIISPKKSPFSLCFSSQNYRHICVFLKALKSQVKIWKLPCLKLLQNCPISKASFRTGLKILSCQEDINKTSQDKSRHVPKLSTMQKNLQIEQKSWLTSGLNWVLRGPISNKVANFCLMTLLEFFCPMLSSSCQQFLNFSALNFHNLKIYFFAHCMWMARRSTLD